MSSKPVVRGQVPEWHFLTEPRFTRLIEALVDAELAKPGTSVEPVDGRGGDGGVDIRVTSEGSTRIFQLKFFPEGFDGIYNTRRKQITESLATAVENVDDMTEWILVVPAEPTRSGWAFIGGLRNRYRDRKCTITVWSKARLDRLCGRHQDVVTSFLRDDDYFREEMKNLRAEQALLATTEDLQARVAGLGRLAGEMDPHWALDFAYRNGVTETIVRARHPHAQERSPISISFQLDLSQEEPALQQSVQRLLDFGWGQGPVEIPGRAIRSFSVQGPEWLARDDRGVVEGFTFAPVEDGPQEWPDIRLTLSRAGRRLGTYVGSIPRVGRGHRGLTLTMQFHKHITITMAFPTDGPTVRVDFNVACDFSGRLEVSDVQKASRMLLNLDNADAIDIEVAGRGPLGRGAAIAGTFDESFGENLRLMNELAGDLLVIQQELDVSFPFPSQVNGIERVTARGLRQMLQGQAALAPLSASFGATMRYDVDDVDAPAHVREFLRGQPGQMRLEQEPAIIELFGENLELDGLVLWHPSVRLERRDGNTARIVATDGTPARTWIPTRLAPEQDGRPTPWNLHGIEERPLPPDAWYVPGGASDSEDATTG